MSYYRQKTRGTQAKKSAPALACANGKLSIAKAVAGCRLIYVANSGSLFSIKTSH
jgi:hypothetical protein